MLFAAVSCAPACYIPPNGDVSFISDHRKNSSDNSGVLQI